MQRRITRMLESERALNDENDHGCRGAGAPRIGDVRAISFNDGNAHI
jgi:hypothetical protein